MLNRLNRLDRPIRVPIIGAGAMEKGLYYQCGRIPGFSCVGLAYLDLAMWNRSAAPPGSSKRCPQGIGRSPPKR